MEERLMSPADDGRIPRPPGKAALLGWTAVAIAVGGLIVFGAVLPAEFNQDPLGLGKLTGIARLWAAPENDVSGRTEVSQLAQFYPAPANADVIEIPLGCVGCGAGPYALEYKVRLKKGAVLLYDWEAVGLSDFEDLEYDFHGHTLAKPGEEMTVATHKQAVGASGHGSLVAPFDGIQGWYFDNSAKTPITIRIRLRGYYELVAPGEVGNEMGIVANLPAEQVKAKMVVPKPRGA
jgi:hypothetical protein